MKNEPNNVRPKAAPIKRINGSKVCKDGLEVLCLLPNINTRWVSAVERFLRRAKKKKKTHILQKINVNAPQPNSGSVLSGFYLAPELFESHSLKQYPFVNMLHTNHRHHIHGAGLTHQGAPQQIQASGPPLTPTLFSLSVYHVCLE